MRVCPVYFDHRHAGTGQVDWLCHHGRVGRSHCISDLAHVVLARRGAHCQRLRCGALRAHVGRLSRLGASHCCRCSARSENSGRCVLSIITCVSSRRSSSCKSGGFFFLSDRTRFRFLVLQKLSDISFLSCRVSVMSDNFLQFFFSAFMEQSPDL